MQFQRAADATLAWQIINFGLVPAQLTVRSSVNDESLTIQLRGTPSFLDTPLAREVHEFSAMQTYLLDRFGVSDELSQVRIPLWLMNMYFLCVN